MMAEFDDIPESLKRDLKATSPGLPIPANADDAVRAVARAELSRRSIGWRWAGALGAIAAVIAVLLAVGVTTKWTPQHAANNLPRIPNDITGDGNVDIRDAMVLARMLKAGQSVRAPWNDSIVLTETSVTEIVEQVVRVAPLSNAAAPAGGAGADLAARQVGCVRAPGKQGAER